MFFADPSWACKLRAIWNGRFVRGSGLNTYRFAIEKTSSIKSKLSQVSNPYDLIAQRTQRGFENAWLEWMRR